MNLYVIVVCCLFTFCRSEEAKLNFLSDKINNFTLELLFFTNSSSNGANLVISPVTVWTTLLVLEAGATGDIQKQISGAIRVLPSTLRKGNLASNFNAFIKNHEIHSPHLDLQKVSGIFIDKNRLPEMEFFQEALKYKTTFIPLDVLDPVKIKDDLNKLQAHFNTLKLINDNDLHLENDVMLPYSAMYFKGLWTYHFDTHFTTKKPFYDDNGNKIGEVDMMYNRHTFPNVYIDILQAHAVELPFANDNKLSMMVFLPYAGVSLHDAFKNFAKTSFSEVFDEFRQTVSATESPKEILVVMPKIRTRTRVNLKNTLENMGVYDLFDSESYISLPKMARMPINVKKFIHKVEIDLNEEGVTKSEAMNSVIGTRVGGLTFIANRPFVYFVVEKITNTILFCGFYVVPT
ncbi:unnamed protein product [Colias eurytheme]|nr:unnamed protein product [Colias eurytheme]